MGNSQRKLVLIMLADIANEKQQCWPSHQYLADRSECSKRTVINHIAALSEAGFISIQKRFTGDGKSTSNLYTVSVSMGVQDLHPSEAGVQHLHGEGAADSPLRGAASAHNTPTLITLPIDTPTVEDKFDEFWSVYPRKSAKKSARAAWKKIKPELHTTLITDCLCRIEQGEWDLNQKTYIPHPATYLNGEYWENEIIPRADFNQKVDFSAIAREAEILQ